MPTIAVDTFAGFNLGLDDPPPSSALVTPDDSNDLPYVTRGFLIAVDGALKVTLLDGTTIVYPSGTWATQQQHVLRITRVWSTGTGAGMGIVAFW
jgi:hypothetical protein